MKHHHEAFLRRLLLLLVCLCLLPLPAPAAAATKNLTIGYTVTTYQNRARELVKKLNAYRKQNGLAALTMTADLESAAIQRGAELFVLFDHVRPDLSDFDTVLSGYPSLKGGEAVAECIAAGYTSAEDTLADWRTNADAHLTDADFTHVGVACVYLKDSYNEYYWAMVLQKQPEGFQGKAAADSVKAGKAKSVSVSISPDMYKKADNSHKRFELRVNALNLKNKQTGQPTVYLYDRYGVKIGKCDLSTLSYKSSNTALFTVTADGTVRRKKTGTGTLTITAQGLSSAKCTVTIGSGGSSSSGSSSSGSQNAAAVTAATIGERKPELTLKEYTQHAVLSVYVRGASGYVLYRASAKNGNYVKAEEQATTKRWDCRLEAEDMEKTWYYKVRAYKNSNGRRVYSEYSAVVKVAP